MKTLGKAFVVTTFASLLVICIACGGVPATPTTSSGVQGPRSSTNVSQGNNGPGPNRSQQENGPSIDSPPTEESRKDSQTIDPYEGLVIDWLERGQPKLRYAVGEIGKVPHLETIQIIDGDSCLCRVGDSSQVILLNDVSTNGMVDGHAFSVKLALITGTTQYQNVLGSTNTVFVLQAISTAAAEEAMFRKRQEDIRKAEEAERQRLAEVERMKEELRESQFRNWTSADGQFSVEARLERYSAGKVVLERRDNGEMIDVPEDVLSESDLQYISEEFKQRAKAARQLRP